MVEITMLCDHVVDGSKREAGEEVETRRSVAGHLIRMGKAKKAEAKESKKSSSKKKAEPKKDAE